MAITSTYITSLETAMTNMAARGGAVRVSINGRTVEFSSLESLQKHYEWAQAQYNAETYGGAIDVKFVGVDVD